MFYSNENRLQHKMRLLFLSLPCSLVLVAITGILLLDTNAIATEQVVLKYGIFSESLAVKDLTTFAQTGELSSSLRINFALARLNPKLIRQVLTEPVNVDLILLDRVLNSPIGNLLLDEISQTIHTPSRRADRQALRSALILSASRDRQVTLLEVIENYPTSEVEVEGERLVPAYRLLRRLAGTLEDFLKIK